MAEPASKRRKVNSDDPSASTDERTGVKHSESFWLDDGNIILQAENVLFRVHRSMLARHSTIFKDMFAIPQPEEPLDPIVEGCPVVTLSDKADDVECILSIFYDNVNVVDLEKAISIKQLAVILCLGKKYDITYLRDRALERLRRCFPTTLQAWDASFNDANGPTIDFDLHPNTTEAVISLGREHDINTILPAAFLCYASQSPPEKILRGNEDILAQEERVRCILGRDALIRAIHSIVRQWSHLNVFMPEIVCATGQCSALKSGVLQGFEDALWLTDERTLWDLNRHMPYPSSAEVKALCKPCAASVQVCYHSAREEIWGDLPSFFDLPGWDELRDFDT